MPSLRGHIVAAGARGPTLSALLGDGTIRLALAMNALVMLTAFLVVPNIAPHLLQNLGYPRDRLDLGYMVGGAASFLIMRVAGHAIDRYGAARVSVVGTVVLIGVLYFAFIAPGAIGTAGVLAVFVLFMGAMSVRNVSMSSLSTRVPRANERAGYMSLQSTAQHLSSATGAFVSSRLLHEAPGGRLSGISTVSTIVGGARARATAPARRDQQARHRPRTSDRVSGGGLGPPELVAGGVGTLPGSH